jgi:hypothetical protein
VSLDWLTDTTILGIQLHVANHPSTLLRNPNQSHPFVFTVDLVADDLGSLQRRVAFENFDWTRCIRIDGPVVNGRFSDKTDRLVVNPLPKGDVFSHDMGFDFGFQLEIEDLKLSLSFESDDFG